MTEASEQGSCPKNIERDGGQALTLGPASCRTRPSLSSGLSCRSKAGSWKGGAEEEKIVKGGGRYPEASPIPVAHPTRMQENRRGLGKPSSSSGPPIPGRV